MLFFSAQNIYCKIHLPNKSECLMLDDNVHCQTLVGPSSFVYMVIIIITRSHPEMVGDMSRVTLNFDLSKIPFVHF